MEGENSGVEGVGQYFPGRPSPLDVLMHVENNLTAKLLHSFSFLPGLLLTPSPLPSPRSLSLPPRPRWTCQATTPSRPASRRGAPTGPFLSFCTLGHEQSSRSFPPCCFTPIEPTGTRSSSSLVCPFSRSSNDRPPPDRRLPFSTFLCLCLSFSLSHTRARTRTRTRGFLSRRSPRPDSHLIEYVI